MTYTKIISIGSFISSLSVRFCKIISFAISFAIHADHITELAVLATEATNAVVSTGSYLGSGIHAISMGEEGNCVGHGHFDFNGSSSSGRRMDVTATTAYPSDDSISSVCRGRLQCWANVARTKAAERANRQQALLATQLQLITGKYDTQRNFVVEEALYPHRTGKCCALS